MRKIQQHFINSKRKLFTHFDHAALAEHPDNKGMPREGFIKIFLENNLPGSINYFTGEIIDENDQTSGQMDIILSPNQAPKINLFDTFNVSYNDFTLGAIEVKSNLTSGETGHLYKALNLSRKVNSLIRNTKLQMISQTPMALFQNTPFFIFAYNGPQVKTLLDNIDAYRQETGLNLTDFAPQVITVLQQNYSIVRNDGWVFDHIPKGREYYGIYSGEDCLFPLYQYIYKLSFSWDIIKPQGEIPINNYFKPLQ